MERLASGVHKARWRGWGAWAALVLSACGGLEPTSGTEEATTALPLAGEIQVNFQDPATVPPAGYLRDSGEPYGARTGAYQGTGFTYGWVVPGTSTPLNLAVGGTTPGNGRNRGTSFTQDVRLATLMHMQGDDVPQFNGTPAEGAWELQLPAGRYTVTVSVGDAEASSSVGSTHRVRAEGQVLINGFVASSTVRFASAGAEVSVTDGRLTLDAVGGTNTKLNSVTVVPVVEVAPNIATSTAELIFSGVKGTTSAARTVEVRNTGGGSLTLTALSLTGSNASAFRLVGAPTLPLTLGAGASVPLQVSFAPGSTLVGALSATLTIASNDADTPSLSVGLYGLSTQGEQGSNEPTMHNIVRTLGYAIDVGGTGLLLGTGPAPIGEEVLVPLFRRAGPGAVTLTPVARYSPDDLLPFGYYTLSGTTPTLHPVATIALDQEQALLPALVPGGASGFDPGDAPFGLYVGATSYANRNTFTQDALNAGGPLAHAVRTYPLKNRVGQPVPNSYLVAFEPASNGDYQDYVFVLSNVVPAPTYSSLPTVRINAGGPTQTVNGVTWDGCTSLSTCGGRVTGGFAYTQSSPPPITGVASPANAALYTTEWTGGQSQGIPAGGTAFTFTVPVPAGQYRVRLHFTELNKNGPGLRVFDVNLEGGAAELVDLDLYARTGGMGRVWVREFLVNSTDGDVSVAFVRKVENAKVSALEIIPTQGFPPAPLE